MHALFRRQSLSKVAIVRLAILAFLAVTAGLLGLRELVNSSTYQLFGDSVARIHTTEKVVALTFDDGPHPRHTPVVLDVLDTYGVKATFFLMGRNLERHQAVAQEVVRRGHEIGNHSYSHPKMVLMSPARVREEIERTDGLIRRLGVTGPIHFRPPHAVKFVVLPYVLTRMNKLSVLGDVDPEEWKEPGAAVMTASIMRQVRPGSIIGLHDTLGTETIQTLRNILQALTAEGYRFETVSAFVRRRP